MRPFLHSNPPTVSVAANSINGVSQKMAHTSSQSVHDIPYYFSMPSPFHISSFLPTPDVLSIPTASTFLSVSRFSKKNIAMPYSTKTPISTLICSRRLYHHGKQSQSASLEGSNQSNDEKSQFFKKFQTVSKKCFSTFRLKELEERFGSPEPRRHKYGYLGVIKIRSPDGKVITCVGFYNKKARACKLALVHAQMTIDANKGMQPGSKLKEIPPITISDVAETMDNYIPTLHAGASRKEREEHLERYMNGVLPITGDPVFDQAAEFVSQYSNDDRRGIKAMFHQSHKLRPHLSRHNYKGVTFWVAHMKIPGYDALPAVGVSTVNELATHHCYIHGLLILRFAKEGQLDLSSVPPKLAGLIQFYVKANSIPVKIEKLPSDEGERYCTSKVSIGSVSAEGRGVNPLEAQKSAECAIATQLSSVDTLFSTLYDVSKTTSADINSSIPSISFSSSVRDRIKKEFSELHTTEVAQLLAPKHLNEPLYVDPSTMFSESTLIKQRRDLVLANDNYRVKFESTRKSLTIAEFEKDIIRTVRDNQVTIICGTTGCGKTTQVPQYILDDAIQRNEGAACKMYVTQPRRINAVSISERIATERLQEIGQDFGYWVRLDKKAGRHGTLMTTGILMSLLVSDPFLTGVSHLVIDEIHERDINCDVILSLVKVLCQRRPELRVVLMSATMQSNLFQAYFKDAPLMNVMGRMFPVTKTYLEEIEVAARKTNYHPFVSQYLHTLESSPKPPKIDPSVIAFVVRHAIETEPIGRDKSILIFVPGWADIVATERTLSNDNPGAYQFTKLHSSVSMEGQRACFRPTQPGKTKVIIATNIAESGVTIDGVTVVIDSCTVFLTFYSQLQRNSSFGTTMKKIICAKSNMIQRLGRAGRTQNGRYFGLIPEFRFEEANEFQPPEILRVSLENVVLRLLGMGFSDAPKLLEDFIEPPPHNHVERAMEDLKELGAVDAQGNLTLLGFHLAKIPTDPRQSKIILSSMMLGCMEGGMSVVASTEIDPFTANRDLKKEVRSSKRLFALGSNSDHLAKVNAVHSWVVNPAIGQKHNLDVGACRKLMQYREQYRQVMRASLNIGGEQPTNNGNNVDGVNDAFSVVSLRAAVASGYYPNVALCYKDTSKRSSRRMESTFRTKIDTNISLSTGCAIDPKNSTLPSPFYVVYDSIFVPPQGGPVATNASYTTIMELLLFAAPSSKLTHHSGLRLGFIDDWIPFQIDAVDFQALLNLKTAMDIRMWDTLENPRDSQAQQKFSQVMSICKELLRSFTSKDEGDCDEDADDKDFDDDNTDDESEDIPQSKIQHQKHVSLNVIDFHNDTAESIEERLKEVASAEDNNY